MHLLGLVRVLGRARSGRHSRLGVSRFVLGNLGGGIRLLGSGALLVNLVVALEHSSPQPLCAPQWDLSRISVQRRPQLAQLGDHLGVLELGEGALDLRPLVH